MDNDNNNENNLNDNNLNDNQFLKEELNNASDLKQEETLVAESENNTQENSLDTQAENIGLNLENNTEEAQEDKAVRPSYSEPAVETEKPAKKKLAGKLVALLVILAVILAGSITAFANRSKLANTLAMKTKSASEYYAFIEQKNLDKQIDTFTKCYGKSLDYFKNGISTDNNLTFSISPQFTMMMGLTEIKPISAKFESSTKNGSGNLNGTVSYNDKVLTSLEMLYDMSTSDYYFKVPELSTAYLLMSMQDMMDASAAPAANFDYKEYMNNISELANGNLLSEEVLNSMLKKYSSNIYSNIETIEIKKNVEVSASDIKSSYNKLTVTMTDKDIYNMVKSILEDAKSDKDLVKILVALQVLSENEYNESIDTAINDLKANEATLTNEPLLNMILYVDGNGNIMGREFIIIDNANTSFGYTTTKNGSKMGFDAWVKENDASIIEITADGNVNNDGFTGDSVISFNNFNESYGEPTATSFKTALKNVKLVDNKIDGKFTLTSDALLGMEFVADFKATDKQQDMNIKLMAGGMEAVEMLLTSKEVPFKEVQMPPSSVQTFNMSNDMESYIGTADLDGFLANIQTVLGEDFGQLFSGLLPGM